MPLANTSFGSGALKILIHISGTGVGGNETLLRDLMQQGEKNSIEYVLVTTEKLANSLLGDLASEVYFLNSGQADWSRIFLKSKPELAVGFHGDIYQMALSARRRGVPAIWSCGHPFLEGEIQPLSLLFQKIIVQSHFLARQLESCQGEPIRQLSIIQNGIDTERFQPASPGKRRQIRDQLGIADSVFLVGYPARLARYKCHLDLLGALELLCDRGEEGHREVHLLCMIGKDVGIERTMVWDELWAATLGSPARNRIHFVSAFAPYMVDFYSATDCLVFPARNEGLGCAVLEGMSMQIPVILSRSGGFEEILSPVETSEKCGLMHEPGDRSELSLAIAKLSSDPGLCVQLGKRGRERVEKQFSKDKMVQNYHEIFEQLGGVPN